MKQNKNNKVYFIAELNTSHFGDLNIAKKMGETGSLIAQKLYNEKNI